MALKRKFYQNFKSVSQNWAKPYIFFERNWLKLTLVLCLGWNVRLIAYVGQWVTNKIFYVHILTVSVSYE